MKRKMKIQFRGFAITLFAGLLAALAPPDVRAQSAEELQQLKDSVQQMQKTIEELNKRILEMEKAKAAPPPPLLLMRSAMETNSPSIQTIEKIASGQAVAGQSPVTDRGALNDQQEAASRPKDFTLDPKFQGFIPI